MKTKKMFLSVMLLATEMLFVGGCGKQAEPVSVELTETVKEADTEESPEESPEPTTSPTAEPEESMESPEAGDNPEEADTTEEESGQDPGYGIISIDDTVMYATADCNIRSGAGTQYDKVGSLSYAQEVTVNGKVEADEGKLWYVIKTEDGSTQMVSASMLSETKPAAQTSSANGSGSGSKGGGSTGNTGNPDTASLPSDTASTSSQATPTQPAPEQPTQPTPEPVHNHGWKEHTATKQVWVPNIVVVDDYEIQNVEVGKLYSCNCGFQTTDGSVIDEHGINHVLNGEMDNFGISTIYEQQQVKVGSHEEDHGHYENSSYVDYYYCDCGATK